MIKLDNRDVQILLTLQTEGRIAKSDLAKRVNLSPTPCWERLKRLEQAGIIQGYGAHISLANLTSSTTILMEAELASHQSKDFERFENAVLNTPEIVECWAVGGGIDYVLKFVCHNVDTYQRLVDRMLNDDIGLKRYFTYIVTKPVKCTPAPPIQSLLNEDGSAR